MTQPPSQPGWWQPPAGQPNAPQWQQPQGYPPQGYPGQAPPPQGGYGGGFQLSTSYGGLGAFGQAPQAKGPRSKKPWLIGGGVVVVLLAGGATAWALGAFQGEVLDEGSVQNGVVTVLRESFGESDVRDVRCPADQPIKAGSTFDCSITLAGQPKKVSIRVLNDKPEFEVGAPK
ncbi:DUF4333 domain-containing protein [Amycolatopsis nigrescens]|uniref:DUF4333 domain-containing protein n=1 Tax=Amycolatopsis nigrescens TaxID=381445 RepID=UPI00035CC6AB|nr:DUF4333 domain-containing protein [Amycolatopsis nigrescens]